jgi:hypothetical protein
MWVALLVGIGIGIVLALCGFILLGAILTGEIGGKERRPRP